MKYPQLDEWLQARLDGVLDPIDAVRLDQALAESEAARRRATEFETLGKLLTELGPAEPPDGFTKQVMGQISLEADRRRAQVIPFSKGGLMIRKAMWGLAAAAAIVLAVYSITGFPPVGRGTEGTIGAAQKHQTPQIADKDVKLGDQAAQEFLQSDAFEQLAQKRSSGRSYAAANRMISSEQC